MSNPNDIDLQQVLDACKKMDLISAEQHGDVLLDLRQWNKMIEGKRKLIFTTQGEINQLEAMKIYYKTKYADRIRAKQNEMLRKRNENLGLQATVDDILQPEEIPPEVPTMDTETKFKEEQVENKPIKIKRSKK